MSSVLRDVLDDFRPSWVGCKLIVSGHLPLSPPAPAEDWRRFVRHGFAAARSEKKQACFFPDSLGEVGPRPGARTHALRVGDTLYVSRALYDQFKAHIAALEES